MMEDWEVQEQPMGFYIHYLFESAMMENWDEVERLYKINPSVCKAKLTESEDTALHIAIASSSLNRRDARSHAKVVRKLVESVPPEEAVEILKAPNDKGDTPLHLAAALGSVAICKVIVSEDRKQLISERNLKGETPLFLAAFHGKMKTFLMLSRLYRDTAEEPDDRLYRRNDGDTVLHSAISGEYFELAYQIIGHNPNLVGSINQEGISPLHILARKPNVFKSSSNLRLFDRMIYSRVLVRELKMQKSEDTPRDVSPNYPNNYQTCVNFICLCRAVFRTIIGLGTNYGPRDATGTNYGPRDAENPEEKRLKVDNHFPKNYDTCIRWFEFAMTIIQIVLGLGIPSISDIRKKKQKHKWAVQIMNELIKHEAHYKYSHNGDRPADNVDDMYLDRIMPPAAPPEEDDLPGSNSQDKQEYKHRGKPDAQTEETPIVAAMMDIKETVKKILETSLASIRDLDLIVKEDLRLTVNPSETQDAETQIFKRGTPFLLAAKMGITEMVEKILQTFPMAIRDLDADGKNALLLAVEYRQTKVCEMLMMMKLPEFVIYHRDNGRNSVMHLAAKFPAYQNWIVPGGALQMLCEIRWYEYVKQTIPPKFSIMYNNNGETANEIFMKTHAELLRNEREWLTTTSEAGIVAATFIATVAYATSSTVPGGLNQATGYPLLENQPSFHVYSVTSVLAFFFSVAALLSFLSIFTSRFQQQDFGHNLPQKLLCGLICLSASFIAMLISFCTGHSFVLKRQFPNGALPTYIIACLPIICFIMAKLTFYFDWIWSMNATTPLPSYRVYDI